MIATLLESQFGNIFDQEPHTIKEFPFGGVVGIVLNCIVNSLPFYIPTSLLCLSSAELTPKEEKSHKECFPWFFPIVLRWAGYVTDLHYSSFACLTLKDGYIYPSIQNWITVT